MRAAVALAGLVAMLAVAEPALAFKVAVVRFEGPKDRTLQLRVASALEADGVEVATPERSAGDDPAALRDVARAAGADAVITGRTVVKKKRWTTTLEVRRGSDGELLGEATLEGPWLPALLEVIDHSAAEKLAAGLSAAATNGEAEVTPLVLEETPVPRRRAAEADEGARTQADPGGGARQPALAIRAGVRLFRRTFDYSQDVFGTLRPYASSLSPAPGASLEWYPGAHAGDGPLADIGVVGSFERGIGTVSRFENAPGRTYTTTMQSLDAGLRYRFHLGDHELGVSGRYAAQSFEIEGDTDPAAVSALGARVQRDLLPDVRYSAVRPGLDVRLSFGDVLLGATAGYRFVLDAGDLGSPSWFSSLEVMAGDAGIFGGYALGDGVALIAGAEITRYGLDMRSRPADLRQGRAVAGGAVDQFASGWLALEWRGADADAEPEARNVASR